MASRARVGACLSLLCALPAWAGVHGWQQPSGNWAVLQVDPSSPGATISSSLVGFWISKGPGGFGNNWAVPSNTQLISLLATLGTNGSVRVGGTPCASSETPGSYQTAPVTLQQTQDFHDFLAAIGSGWASHVNWCLNMAYTTMGVDDITYASGEVANFESVFGSGVTVYAIGNEPDLYYSSYAEFESSGIWQG